MPNVRSFFRGVLALLSILTIVGCSQYSTVKPLSPAYTCQPMTPLGAMITKAGTGDRKAPLRCLGAYVEVLEQATKELQKNAKDSNAQRDYSFVLSRIISTLSDAKLDSWAHPLRLPAPDGGADFVLQHRPDPRPGWNPALYEFTPADQFDCSGSYVTNKSIKAGLGAPLVAVGRGQNTKAKENFAMGRVYYGVTAVARFERGRRCVISFEDPLASETVTMGGKTYPLAADFTVPLAVLLARENPKQLELSRLLSPQKYAETARIARLQPYDPNKQVVLCVHGLMDSPATWTPLINTLRSDPEIRKRYQFWFYSYPSGYPYPYSAAILRDQLDAIQKKYPLDKKMVVIGHSMGGIITRLLGTDSGDTLWNSAFRNSPETTRLSPQSRKILEDSLVFKHRPEVGRMIFIAAPHRGSDLASSWLAKLAARLISSPVTLLKIGKEMSTTGTLNTSAARMRHIPNSVDTLSPNNRFVKAVNKLPITPSIPFHSIIGDRGKGGNLDHTKPISSDGFVPYWSSHLEGAVSELVVPSGHSAHQNLQAIDEVKRILLRY